MDALFAAAASCPPPTPFPATFSSRSPDPVFVLPTPTRDGVCAPSGYPPPYPDALLLDRIPAPQHGLPLLDAQKPPPCPLPYQAPPLISHHPHPMAIPISSYYSYAPGAESPDSDRGGREPSPPPSSRAKDTSKRTHQCWMCHKAFDRPSTLKKHLLVHTGEKAFVCPCCKRRFGVASNLTRHNKTCRAAQPSSSSSNTSTTLADDAASTAATSDTASTPSPVPASVSRPCAPRKRKSESEDPSEPPSADPALPPSSAQSQPRPRPHSHPSHPPPTQRKRARRAPSPSRWVPPSLSAFDLTPLTSDAPMPLPPVHPFGCANASPAYEERDSFDESADPHPYAARGWRGRLPGPGLLAANVTNTSGGQLVIF
ncbi:uncharacterized protein BXZ73DRAFT_102570 [Epithele typhae]|uniref:uncharacterized protein n=1 Tax=Epithele typhae TaxID=378194 RepID=UPI00200863A8|nr:uncharacterized protein BXZ73DRAFT_102570 [Epithele typhae]KAH9927430.1 hypothetical protein BXZ73DRAFT_102570 [Epithele typhae]